MFVFVLIRAMTYAVVFVGLVLLFVPAWLLRSVGVPPPAFIGYPQVAGVVAGGAGAVLVMWCVLSFAVIGRGTPAPFDPPRRLVVKGPYRYVRNPMYIGAGLALAGAALYHQSIALLGYTTGFFIVAHLFVVFYEEPALRQGFGEEYKEYCKTVKRWWPIR